MQNIVEIHKHEFFVIFRGCGKTFWPSNVFFQETFASDVHFPVYLKANFFHKLRSICAIAKVLKISKFRNCSQLFLSIRNSILTINYQICSYDFVPLIS